MPDFSFIILTYNEETHLPRLLESIKGLNADIFILDSGSTDGTLNIAEKYGAVTAYNEFINHPTQWDYALHHFSIKTPWAIGLDADQIDRDCFRCTWHLSKAPTLIASIEYLLSGWSRVQQRS